MRDETVTLLTSRIIEFHETLLSWEAEVVAKSGLSSTQTHIVEYLWEHAPPKMSEIANRMGITTGSLTVAIDALEQKGFVERKLQEGDRRSYKISLTKKGEELYRNHSRLHIELTQNGIADFTPEEAEMFSTFLKRFRENI